MKTAIQKPEVSENHLPFSRSRVALSLAILSGLMLLATAVFFYTGLALPLAFKIFDALSGRPRPALALEHYRVVMDARPITGIAENASGLTYHSDRNTLFSVINRPPQVVELTLDGQLLRSLPVDGVDDLEGITHIEGNDFFLADERSQQLVHVRINDGQTRIITHSRPRLTLAVDAPGNLGFEGVSWDHRANRLFVVKEKRPLRLLELKGLKEILQGGKLDLDIREWNFSQAWPFLIRDLSSVSYHEDSGMMFLLSHESHLVLGLDPNRNPATLLTLRRGWHGLTKDVPQAEGIAIAPDRSIFIISEPNLMYRFAPP